MCWPCCPCTRTLGPRYIELKEGLTLRKDTSFSVTESAEETLHQLALYTFKIRQELDQSTVTKIVREICEVIESQNREFYRVIQIFLSKDSNQISNYFEKIAMEICHLANATHLSDEVFAQNIRLIEQRINWTIEASCVLDHDLELRTLFQKILGENIVLNYARHVFFNADPKLMQQNLLFLLRIHSLQPSPTFASPIEYALIRTEQFRRAIEEAGKECAQHCCKTGRSAEGFIVALEPYIQLWQQLQPIFLQKFLKGARTYLHEADSPLTNSILSYAADQAYIDTTTPKNRRAIYAKLTHRACMEDGQ